MKKTAMGVFIILAVMQVVFVTLKITQVWDIPILWLFVPMLIGLLLGTTFIVGYVLWIDKQEKL